MIYNKIPAVFSGTSRIAIAEPVNYQYDVTQILVISGLELPEYYEVDFCNVGDTQTITMVGTADGVAIPDEFLATGERIKAYIVIQGEDEGAVETRYEVVIPVNKRPRRTDIQPTPAEQQQIDSLVAILEQAAQGNDDIFWAETDKTSYADLLAAYNSGKQILVKSGNFVYTLSYYYGGRFKFSAVATSNTESDSIAVAGIQCTEDNGWGNNAVNIVSMSSITNYVDEEISALQTEVVVNRESGVVSATLQPNTIYRFVGEVTDINLYFAEPKGDILPHYNFTVDVGETVPLITFNHAAIAFPDGYHGMEANHYYEFDAVARTMEGIQQPVYFWKIWKW